MTPFLSITERGAAGNEAKRPGHAVTGTDGPVGIAQKEEWQLSRSANRPVRAGESALMPITAAPASWKSWKLSRNEQASAEQTACCPWDRKNKTTSAATESRPGLTISPVAAASVKSGARIPAAEVRLMARELLVVFLRHVDVTPN